MSQHKKILIVDDSVVLGKSLALFLNKNGYIAEAVSSGESCLHRVENIEMPDLILMDI
ncbi:MAG: response regulator [Spirochaeta sp.]|nr:response regulator [Spirochaeta sp.]